MADINDRTVGGLLAYCDWLRAKNYQSPNGVEAWKTAVNKVFSTVEPNAYEAISLDGLDLDEYVERFRVASGSQYKAETVGVYGRRIKNAMDAQAEYIASGKQVMLSRGSRATRNGDADEPARKTPTKPGHRSAAVNDGAGGELIQFPFPLADGQMAQLKHPPATPKGRRGPSKRLPAHTTNRGAASAPAGRGDGRLAPHARQTEGARRRPPRSRRGQRWSVCRGGSTICIPPGCCLLRRSRILRLARLSARPRITGVRSARRDCARARPRASRPGPSGRCAA